MAGSHRQIGADAQQRLDRMSGGMRGLLAEARARMVKDPERHAAFNSGVVAGLDLAANDSAALALAVGALEDLADPKKTSMRRRDPNCVRYVAAETLDRLEREHGVAPRPGGMRWDRFQRVSGDSGGEPVRR